MNEVIDKHKVIDLFTEAMAKEGIKVDAHDIEADGEFHRIHVDGDKKNTRNAWYKLHFDEHPAGMFGCNKRLSEEKITWTFKGTVPLTPEQRIKLRRDALEKKAAKAKAEQERFEEAGLWANRMWSGAAPNDGSHPYLKRKHVGAHGLRSGKWEVKSKETGAISTIPNALFIPLRDLKKRIWSLQAIFPDDKNFLQRGKTFLQGGRKHGLYYVIGTPKDNTVLLCEGYATGASLHEATGHCVFVCFDAGNMLEVARGLRAAKASLRMVICGDNDRWTHQPMENPGVHYATRAAKAVAGLLCVPEFSSLDGEPTDFNDLHVAEGLAAVAAQVDASMQLAPVAPTAAEPTPPAVPVPAAPAPIDQLPAASAPAEPSTPAPKPPKDESPPSAVQDTGGYFVMLGYDRDRYFFFQHEKKQVLTFTKGDFTDSGLITLAPLTWWEMNYPGERGGIEKKAAMDWLVRGCNKAGIYDAGSRIRGRGAWVDNKRMVFHHGGHLSVDSKATHITDIRSRFVYELSHSLPDPADDALTDAEGQKLLDLAGMFRWSKPGSAALLPGWVALAPLCGALRWRPHVWLTGGPGSGKSTVLEKFVHPLMNGVEIYAQGNSTEAGIRQTLKSDALPVLFDETESNEEKDALRVQNVLSLIRQASTESHAKTYKGTAGGDALSFHIRSMFCLSSIQVTLKQQADVERMTKLALRSKREGVQADDAWPKLKEALYVLERDETLAARLFRRSIDLLPVTLKNIEVFAAVAAKAFGSQRDGDQYGTLIAGTWSLISRELVTPEQARELIDRYDWSEHMDGMDDDESNRVYAALMEAHIRVNGGQTLTVYELVRVAMGNVLEGLDIITPGPADALLQRYGMRVKGGFLCTSNKSDQLRLLMKNTTYSADLRGAFLRVPGASRLDNKTIRIGGVECKAVGLPLPEIKVEQSSAYAVQSGAYDPMAHGDQPF